MTNQRLLGICTSRRNVEDLNHEKYSLYQEGRKVYDNVILVDTRSIYYKFVRGEQKPVIIHKEQNLSNLTTLIVRSTKNRESSTAILAHSLALCGCDILDNLDRFTGRNSSKLMTTLRRFESGVGTDSFFAFNVTGAIQLIQDLYREERFPLIVKPIAGRLGRDIEIVSGLDDALAYARSFFSSRPVDEPLFLQKYMDFKAEYRVLVVYGEALGIVQKHRASGHIVANAAQGGVVSAAQSSDLMEYVTQNVSEDGILGVDVAVDGEGCFHIIEANRAPLWREFELATGINVAQVIISKAKHRWSD